VNVLDLMVGQSIRAGDIPISGSMRLLSPPDAVISHVVSLKAEETTTAETGGAAAAAGSEPEVIKKGKKEEEGSGEAPKGEGKKK
jgi:large subunit ribosomal protein L25